jgi:hypothetical protein
LCGGVLLVHVAPRLTEYFDEDIARRACELVAELSGQEVGKYGRSNQNRTT